jgi:mannose-6-phosphate isomerase-like protein (cupin superfamily)
MKDIFATAAIADRANARENSVLGFRRIRIQAADTGGRLGFFEEIVPAGAGVPLHIHHHEDEMFNIRAGQFRIWCGNDTYLANPGDVAVLPRGIPHRFQNVGDTEGWLDVTVTPGGFESLFLRAEEGGGDTAERFMQLAPAHGLEMLPETVIA